MKKGFFLNKNTVFLLFPVKLKSSCFFENLQIISKTYFLKIFLFFWKSSNNFNFFWKSSYFFWKSSNNFQKIFFWKYWKIQEKKIPTFWDFIYFPNILGFHSHVCQTAEEICATEPILEYGRPKENCVLCILKHLHLKQNTG